MSVLPGYLSRYILKTALVPFSISLLVAALLLLLEQMLRLLDFVLNENGPVDVVWKMLAFLVPHYLGLALPLSLFIGLALAFRKLSLSSEYDSMRASGLSGWRLVRPLFLLSLMLMVLNFVLLAYVQPYARYAYSELRYELQTGLLGARFPVGDFVTVSDDVRMRIGETQDNGAILRDIFVVYRPDSGEKSAFTAKSGTFLKSRDSREILILRLFDGVQMIQRSPDSRPGVLRFEQQDVAIPLPEVADFRERGGEKREVTIDELLIILNQENVQTIEDFNSFRASFHFRLIHTLTFFPIPFLALALGITNQRRPSNIGPVMGIAFVIIYHEILEEWGEDIVGAGASPYTTMWPVYGVFTLISFWLFYLETEKAGGGATARLSAAWQSLIDRIKAVLPARERRQP